jgi:hypothetical protein
VPSPTSSTLSNGVGVEFTHSATGFTRFLRISNGTGDLDTYSISGKFLEGLTESPTSYFSAAFDRPVHAIGFYATDASDWSGTTADDIKVLLTTVSMVVELDLTPGLDPVSLVSGNVMFFGVIDTAEPFLSIALRNESGVSGDSRDGIGIDDLTIGLAATAVPAPGTLPLLLGLLPLLGFLRRRAAAR